MKTIISVGCSWTFGHGVSANETYSAYLQDSLDNCQVINAGHCGCDNRYSVFSAVRLIEKFNPDMIIFQLTTFDRMTLGTDGFDNFIKDRFYDDREDEIYYEENELPYKRLIGIGYNSKTKLTHGDYIASDRDLQGSLVDSKMHTVRLDNYKNFVKILTENVTHSNYNHQLFISNLFLLQQYLKLKKIKAIYFNWIDNTKDISGPYVSKWLDTNHFVTDSVKHWLTKNYPNENFYIDNGFHISAKGNKILSDHYLLPLIRKIL